MIENDWLYIKFYLLKNRLNFYWIKLCVKQKVAQLAPLSYSGLFSVISL